MAHQLLDGHQVGPCIEQIPGERSPPVVGSEALYPRLGRPFGQDVVDRLGCDAPGVGQYKSMRFGLGSAMLEDAKNARFNICLFQACWNLNKII